MDALAAALLLAGDGREDTERGATLLGAAHAVRGAFDHGSLDSPDARDIARRALGGQAFDAAYRSGQALGYGGALALAEDSAAALAGR